ncbi:MAG: TRAP transporter small permease subunit [Alphaproteobacteria bacterium]|nr:MAG: TRAP transporter small permease subunit [Alphaproteobacteria bacterium]
MSERGPARTGALGRCIAAAHRFNESAGQVLGVLALVLVLVQFALVVASAVFAIGSIWLQESRHYLNALIFLGGAGYALAQDAHVRVDLFYHDADRTARAWVDALGTLVFLAPFLFLLWWAGLPFVLESWATREGSTETAGIPFVYVLKATILLAALTLTVQGVALLAERLGILLARDGDRL